MIDITIESKNIGKHFVRLIRKEEDYIFSPNRRVRHRKVSSIKRVKVKSTNTYHRSLKDIVGSDIYHMYASISREIHTLAESNSLKNILKFVVEINSEMMISEALFPINGMTADQKRPIRAHFIHPIVVYLIGKELLNSKFCNSEFENKMADQVSKSSIGKDAYLFAGYEKEPDITIWKSAINRAWYLASLSHDLAYSLIPAFSVEERFFKKDFFEYSKVETFNSRIKSFKQSNYSNVISDSWDRIYRIFGRNLNYSKKKNTFDHGQLMALFIIDTYYNKETPQITSLNKSEKLSLFLALAMIFRHDLWSKPEHIGMHQKNKDPMSTLFCLCDLLAEMRYVWNPLKIGDRDNINNGTWMIDYWLPYHKLSLTFNYDNKWIINLEENRNVDSHIKKESLFNYSLSRGDVYKQKQYKKMFKSLNLPNSNATVHVLDN
jgi:hypothetical protein